MQTATVSTDPVQAPPNPAHFTSNSVLDLNTTLHNLADRKDKKLPFLATLDMDRINDVFTGVITLTKPSETYFLTTPQLVKDIYTVELLRRELNLSIGTFNSMFYVGSAPTLETAIRIRALEQIDRKNTGCIGNLPSYDSISAKFHQIFTKLNALNLSKTKYVSRATVYNVLNAENPNNISFISFAKLVQACAKVENRESDLTYLWEELFNG